MKNDFFDKYRQKIKTVPELLDVIGPFPRTKKVIMCHGVFDVVHPGHVRHLVYAKSKADILVASITTDKHIDKGIYRPHVPEQLRALNLAAFEMVDYVIIDEEAKPLKNLQRIQPDYFAKGFEYTSGGLPASTQEEMDIINGYGGELIFTPGDVVFSSSKFIQLAPPKIKLEKLLSLMNTEEISFDDLRRAVNAMKDYRVHVVGDTIVDSYTRTTLIGGQTKTPTFSVSYQGRDDYIGGAGIVAQHLRAAGAEVIFSTVLGNDNFKNFVVEGLTAAGIKCHPLIDSSRPTTNKNVIIAGGYRLLKIDTLDNRMISDHVLEKLVENIKTTQADAVVFSDFRHGIFNRITIPKLVNAIPAGTYKVADSQVATRWGNITEFNNFDLITPNEREARFSLADQDSTVGRLGGTLMEKTQCRMMILKLGERGIFTITSKVLKSTKNFFSIDSFANQVVDAWGAGDALLAYTTLALLSNGSEVVASILGSFAAACECEMDGNIPVKTEDVLARIDTVEKLAAYNGG
ncbi:MAG: adenylyltransferase/cytidyltransferase family protein [Verrucomicrobia bacterium]|nr:adenylyltransferase/cytidyltransferase family protein [Verrucomicrobiota bacterium]